MRHQGVNIDFKHYFELKGKTITYVRGTTKHGCDFEAYVPHEQSGQAISHVAGLCVMPSDIVDEQRAREVFNSFGLGNSVLNSVNETGYYGNTLLQTALEGRASSVVYAAGFTHKTSRWKPWERITKRILTHESAQNQVKDALYLGERLSINPSNKISLQAHSLSTVEAVRLMADQKPFREKDYSEPYNIKSIVLHSCYTTPEDALSADKSMLRIPGNIWHFGFKKLKSLYRTFEKWKKGLGRIVPGIYCAYPLQFQINPKFQDPKKAPKGWKGAFFLNGGCANYFLDGMGSAVDALKDSYDSGNTFMDTRDLLFVQTGQDSIFSYNNQVTVERTISSIIGSNGNVRDSLKMPGHNHCPFVNYGERRSHIMQDRLNYIARISALTK